MPGYGITGGGPGSDGIGENDGIPIGGIGRRGIVIGFTGAPQFWQLVRRDSG